MSFTISSWIFSFAILSEKFILVRQDLFFRTDNLGIISLSFQTDNLGIQLFS